MLLALENVGHRYGRDGDWLFRGLTIDFHPGEVYALTGPSGSGKSTLLSLLARRSRPREGAVRFAEIGKVSWVFQNPFGSPHRTALDHVTLPILARGEEPSSAEHQADELMLRFGLQSVAQRRFGDLSGGEAQRLMLARGLASRPSVLLVDEPTAQLDRRTAERVDSAIRAVADPRTIVIVATHDERTRAACTKQLDLGSYEGPDSL
ncbi:ATP-binding cassette domain-containing protein [Leifsonia sp. TF02-11]|uniref:ATP-binding cassette domain-containing protein n=1 Tax=Leifsonia sp. TF02-11 TaxID=2815212 RepID=UPI001AA1950A|nr:ATP-binding cassette domain-containing protein [Leifsonia sp. TF02-11]MBO1740681.1 ATP-binding cassette domain-containing protein [Leifsonia sp. TF02-11]